MRVNDQLGWATGRAPDGARREERVPAGLRARALTVRFAAVLPDLRAAGFFAVAFLVAIFAPSGFVFQPYYIHGWFTLC